MIKIGFWYDISLGYSGGLNYHYNLVFAFKKIKQEKYKLIFFFPSDIDKETEQLFKPFCEIHKIKVLKKNTFSWILNKIFLKLFKINFYLIYYFKKNNIKILSHSTIMYNKYFNIKIISWIPDFQYVYLKNLFKPNDLKILHNNTKKILKLSDHLILSSNDAFNHLKDNYGKNLNIKKVSILRFVTQVNFEIRSDNSKVNNIKHRKFFYIPNQFWSHKNHKVVFKAVSELKNDINDLLLVCSGNPFDFKNNTTDYFRSLNEYISKKELENNILNLGFISYNDVNVLMKSCIAVINPSYFEGWSSTVEEAKSFNKNIILSDIPIHKEQNPNRGFFFEKDNYKQLMNIMENIWNRNIEAQKDEDLSSLQKIRTIEFGKSYLEILNKVKI